VQKYLQHALLHGIFGIALIAKHRIGNEKGAALVGPDQVMKAVAFSRFDPLKQVFFPEFFHERLIDLEQVAGALLQPRIRKIWKGYNAGIL
jgi:hypothetical protein